MDKTHDNVHDKLNKGAGKKFLKEIYLSQIEKTREQMREHYSPLMVDSICDHMIKRYIECIDGVCDCKDENQE